MPAQYPIGQLCVLRYPQDQDWIVCICRGPTGRRETLGRFPDLAAASDFAIAERDRRRAEGADCIIHFPDDCPCCGQIPSTQ